MTDAPTPAETSRAEASRTGDDFSARLESFVASRIPGARELRIEGLRRVASGYSRENWVFDAEWTSGAGPMREALIARRDPVGSVLVTDRSLEFAVLEALERTPVPAPQPRWLDAKGEWLGRPSVVMTREAGVCDYFVLNGERSLDRRLAIAGRFCDLLVAIHAVDWRALGMHAFLPEPGPGTAAAHAAVDHWERELRRDQLEPQPELDVVAAWLRARAPSAQATVLVHGDFKPGNALMRGEEIGAMLDWETAHLGDPLEDVGWITNPLRAREHQIPGAWERSQILEAYAERTGVSVTESDVHWWNVLANYKLSVIVLTGLRAFVDGRLERVHQTPVPLFQLLFDLIDA